MVILLLVVFLCSLVAEGVSKTIVLDDISAISAQSTLRVNLHIEVEVDIVLRRTLVGLWFGWDRLAQALHS